MEAVSAPSPETVHLHTRLAQRHADIARRYVMEIVAGLVPSDPTFADVHEVLEAAEAGHMAWPNASAEVRRIRGARA